MAFNIIRDLPKEVRDEITDDKYIAVDEAIYSQFDFDLEQIDAYGDIVTSIFLQKIPVTNLPEALTQMPESQTMDLRNLALTIALKRLWPVSFYLRGVDTLITRLGGSVPTEKPMPRIVSDDADEESDDTPAPAAPAKQEFIYGKAATVLARYKTFNDLYLTKKPIKDSEDRLKSPTIANWLQDYLHTMGAEGSSTLKRSQYLVKSKNALILNDAEKANVLNFLISFDEGYPMYWRVAEENYLLVDPELPSEAKARAQKQKAAHALDELLAYYKDVQANFQRLFDEKKKGLEVEMDQKVTKLPDILWDALGLEDQDRGITALAMIIERGILFDMLKTDQRFKGIAARAITAQFGMEAKNFWNGDMTIAPVLAIFWKLLLIEKLHMEEGRAAILADLYSKALGQTISPVFLDLQGGIFHFREVRWENKEFQFA